MARVLLAGVVVMMSACSLTTSLDGFTGGSSDSSDSGPGLADAARDSGAEGGQTATDGGGPPIVVVQRHLCAYKSSPNAFGCAFPVANVASNAFLVHFYYNFAVPEVVSTTVTDDDSNTYSFLDVDDVSCPASKLPNQVCCTSAGSKGTCQGWAIATNVSVAKKNPATITFSVGGGPAPSNVMGAEVLEISGLADAPLDRGASSALSAGSTVQTPTITTTGTGDLVVAGFAFYTSGSTDLTAPPGWIVDQDKGYFAAVLSRIGGPAGSSYGGAGMGTVTDFTTSGTGTILALKRR